MVREWMLDWWIDGCVGGWMICWVGTWFYLCYLCSACDSVSFFACFMLMVFFHVCHFLRRTLCVAPRMSCLSRPAQVKPHKTFAKGKGATGAGVGSGGEEEADGDDALTKTIPRTKLVKVVQVRLWVRDARAGIAIQPKTRIISRHCAILPPLTQIAYYAMSSFSAILLLSFGRKI
jgi:hypothetical protein